MTKHKISTGFTYPLGASKNENGVNFCIYSKSASNVELLLFNHKDDNSPTQSFQLNTTKHKTANYWHICLSNIKDGQLYGFKIDGPETKQHAFKKNLLLTDPYSKSLAFPTEYNRKKAKSNKENSKYAIKSIYKDLDKFDWEGDQPLYTPQNETVIYEMHVGGFTKHPSSKVDKSKRGTYLGLIEKIPYLKKLGITAVELLPIQQFDFTHALTGVNYWGYSPIGFFAPHNMYATNPDNGSAIDEFRTMVKELHKAGIEVILDVVLNHTAEGDKDGPTLSFKGICNSTYYLWDNYNRCYKDYTGCGNTINSNNSVVRRLIMDCLHFWVREMHVDGFRFDLASVMSRDTEGHPIPNPPILREIETDPFLAGTKIIAEAWDAAGLYQVGSFVGDRWSEWNGKFRDDIRKFVKGDENTIIPFVQRFMGSPDIYYKSKNNFCKTINFVTCHDGFTLNDLVSYNDKHNTENGEQSRDGVNENYSWNCGEEGITTSPEIESLRLKQIKNFYLINLFSLGTPMIYMGDEIRRTQKGNNNAYGIDEKHNWFDWQLLKTNKELFEFVAKTIKLRKKHINLFPKYTMIGYHDRINWHGINLNKPDLNHNSHSISFTINSIDKKTKLHLLINMFWEPLTFELPKTKNGWEPLLNTSDSVVDTPHKEKSILVPERTILLLKPKQ